MTKTEIKVIIFYKAAAIRCPRVSPPTRTPTQKFLPRDQRNFFLEVHYSIHNNLYLVKRRQYLLMWFSCIFFSDAFSGTNNRTCPTRNNPKMDDMEDPCMVVYQTLFQCNVSEHYHDHRIRIFWKKKLAPRFQQKCWINFPRLDFVSIKITEINRNHVLLSVNYTGQ